MIFRVVRWLSGDFPKSCDGLQLFYIGDQDRQEQGNPTHHLYDSGVNSLSLSRFGREGKEDSSTRCHLSGLEHNSLPMFSAAKGSHPGCLESGEGTCRLDGELSGRVCPRCVWEKGLKAPSFLV